MPKSVLYVIILIETIALIGLGVILMQQASEVDLTTLTASTRILPQT